MPTNAMYALLHRFGQVWDPPAGGGVAIAAHTALPTADAALRGLPVRTEGATGVADVVAVVAKMPNNSYVTGRIPVYGVDYMEIRNAAAVTLTNGTSAQSPFTAANDTLTVEAATLYAFEM